MNPYALIADGVLILITIVTIIIGCKKGFVALVIGFLAGILTLVLATILCKPLAEGIGALGLRESLEGAFAKLFEGETFTTPIKSIATQEIKELIASLSLPEFLATALEDLVATKVNDVNISNDLTLQAIIASTLAKYVLMAIAWVFLMLVLGITFFFVKRGAKAFNKIPLIGTINRVLGGAVSVIILILALIALTFVFSLFSSILPASVLDYINDTYIVGWFFNTNPLGKVLTSLFI